MFKFTTDIDNVAFPNGTENKKTYLRSVPVEDAAIIEQFPLSEQDVNPSTIREDPSGEESG